MEHGVAFCMLFIYSYISIIVVVGNDASKCKNCIEIEKCPTIEVLTRKERQKWLLELPCKGSSSSNDERNETSTKDSSVTGDYICCPIKNVFENNDTKNYFKQRPDDVLDDNNQLNKHPNNNDDNYNELDINPETTLISNKKIRKRQVMPLPLDQNPYFLKKPTPQQKSITNNNNGFNPDGSNPETSSNNQCAIQADPPGPETGCCGRDTSDTDRINDLQGVLNMYAPPYSQQTRNFYPQLANRNQPYYLPRLRSTGRNNRLEVKLEGKLAGGKKTELDQFPWTALLLLTFDDGNNVASFQCGGSLISSRYIITAAHCVYEAGARLSDVQIILAEYDKRTFPVDCVIGIGEGKTCIQNVLMSAEEVIIHPQFDDTRLHNDIAMIRLRGFAPYTRFIRPICIAPLNIDSESFSNLPLVASGWGRNKKYVSDVKQSTVVNFVPHEECLRSYPNLSPNQLCAAGSTGEDTCKGDSGGPLMILYGGSYYLIGVVSGKRADSPCGTSVPSLYTNVFNYIPWIKNVINSQRQ